jgi:hypothetical protein
MGRIGSTPIGEAFLPSLTISRLERIYRKEKNSKAKLRLLSAMLRRKEGQWDRRATHPGRYCPCMAEEAPGWGLEEPPR